MRQVIAILVGNISKSPLRTGIVDEIARLRLGERFSKRDRGIDPGKDPLGFASGRFGVQGHQMAQGHGHRPARQGVVADVADPADLEPSPDDLDNGGPVVVAQPTPVAMQGDLVKVGQVIALQQVEKAVVTEVRERPGCRRQRLGVRRMGRIEVRAPEFTRACRSMDVRAQALAIAKLQIAHAGPSGRGESGQQ